MRYPKDHKERTRRHVVEVASREFGMRGIDGKGIAFIMQSAGLTNGAFFSHFETKDELATEAVAFAMARALTAMMAETDGTVGMQSFIRSYLSIQHRDNPGIGCPVATLAAEVGRRSSGGVPAAFTDGLESFIDVLAQAWPDSTRHDARGRALALYGLISGCLQMSRATDDRELSSEILSGGIKSALALLNV